MKNKSDITPKKKYPVWFSLLLVLIPIVFIVLLEIVLRLSDYGKDYSPFTEAYPAYPDMLFLNPDITQKYFTNVANPPSVIADGFEKEKRANTYRVFVLGESSAAGWPYVPNASFPRELARRLKFFYPSSNIEVINLGMSAINSYTIKDLVPAVIEQKPDLVVFYTGHNEFYGALGVASSQSLGNSSFLINLYIDLHDFKIFQLLKNLINYFGGTLASSSDSKKSLNNETLMERMVGDNLVPYKSELYQLGVTQFKNNMEECFEVLKENNIPVIAATLTANLKNLHPFENAESKGYPKASEVFNEAKSLLEQGKTNEAKEKFYLAKDLDGLRFRAPEDFNTILKELTGKFKIPLVDINSIFNSKSKDNITGYDLMVDHLHPNTKGYGFIAESIFTEIENSGYYPKSERKSIALQEADTVLSNTFPFTELDSSIADLRIKILTGGYPFVPKGSKNKLVAEFIPKNLLDSLSIEVVDRWTTWEKAHYALADRYYAIGEYKKAAKELSVLIYDRPLNFQPYKQLINMLISARLYDDAMPYLIKLNNYHPDAFTNKWLGSIYLEKKDYKSALPFLERSLKFAEDDPQVWYNITGAYFYTNDIEKAKYAITRCLRINPQNQNALMIYRQLHGQ